MNWEIKIHRPRTSGPMFYVDEKYLHDINIHDIKIGDIIKYRYGLGEDEWDYRVAHKIIVGKNPGEYAIIGYWFKLQKGDCGGSGMEEKDAIRLQKIDDSIKEEFKIFYGSRAN